MSHHGCCVIKSFPHNHLVMEIDESAMERGEAGSCSPTAPTAPTIRSFPISATTFRTDRSFSGTTQAQEELEKNSASLVLCDKTC